MPKYIDNKYTQTVHRQAGPRGRVAHRAENGWLGSGATDRGRATKPTYPHGRNRHTLRDERGYGIPGHVPHFPSSKIRPTSEKNV